MCGVLGTSDQCWGAFLFGGAPTRLLFPHHQRRVWLNWQYRYGVQSTEQVQSTLACRGTPLLPICSHIVRIVSLLFAYSTICLPSPPRSSKEKKKKKKKKEKKELSYHLKNRQRREPGDQFVRETSYLTAPHRTAPHRTAPHRIASPRDNGAADKHARPARALGPGAGRPGRVRPPGGEYAKGSVLTLSPFPAGHSTAISATYHYRRWE